MGESIEQTIYEVVSDIMEYPIVLISEILTGIEGKIQEYRSLVERISDYTAPEESIKRKEALKYYKDLKEHLEERLLIKERLLIEEQELKKDNKSNVREITIKDKTLFNQLANVELSEIKEEGDKFSIKEWMEEIERGNFNEFDGVGYWATETQESNIPFDFDLTEFNFELLINFFEMIVWYNK